MARVCVVGAGPAGCVFAARMAQLGHEVRLIEQERFPRSQLGESLSPGVEPLLKSAGLETALDAHRVTRVRNVWVAWADGLQLREDPREQGLIVDRGAFDLALVEGARSCGVKVVQPACVVDRRQSGGRWRLALDVDGRRETLEADFLAEAGGRAAASGRARVQTGAPTLAVYAYWRGARLPSTPRIEAGKDAWFWGVPLPNGTYNSLAFVDPKTFRAGPGSLAQRFLDRLAGTLVLEDCRGAERIGPTRAIEATSYLARDCIGRNAIRLGDAALAIDPISSSGVQKAIQSALSGAIVANTLLRRPAAADLAMSFYRAQLNDASERHRRWAADHYRTVAATRGGPFWTDRSKGRRVEASAQPSEPVDVRAMAAMPVELSSEAAFVETPCLDGEFVGVAPALRHPRLETPVAYLAGRALAPLLKDLPPGRTLLQIARGWSNRMPLESGLAIAGWLVNHGVLVSAADKDGGRLC
ncbi:MAG: tryptophan 7-halogenase [Roseiarcus sp.]|uniref:flavin-dependent monooxygenase QhpG n=1 Tax=Roseiarcus sp. TaxID=1969460 RepID=UPI003BB07A36